MVSYKCVGLGSVDVFPSPKSQWYISGFPTLKLRKETVNGEQPKSKLFIKKFP